jgi:propane monooxygenase reductase component
MAFVADPRVGPGQHVRHAVTVLPEGREFVVEPGEDILTAGLRQGVDLVYGCRHGKCTTCKYVVVEGDVFQDGASPYALSDKEREAGAVLLCSSFALSRVVLSPGGAARSEVESFGLIPPVEVGGRFVSMAALTTALMEVRLRLASPLPSRAGQHVEVELPGTELRLSYSIVSPPGADELAFIVDRRRRRTLDSFRYLGPGDRVLVRGPFGGFGFRPTRGRPVLMAAMGAGIAPLLAMLRDVPDRQRVCLYYGVPDGDGVPDRAELDGVDVVRVAIGDLGSRGRRLGPLVQTVGRELADASGYDAYVAGDVELCDALTALLLAKGLPEQRLFVQRFYSITG